MKSATQLSYLLMAIFLMSIVLPFSNQGDLDNKKSVSGDQIPEPPSPKRSGSWESGPFIIDDSEATGNGTWAWALSHDWCSGHGNWTHPYIIENLTVNARNETHCIGIRNSTAYFIIRNCTLTNSTKGHYTYHNAGILLENACNGTIEFNNISSNHGLGIHIRELSYNITIRHNVMSENYGGIKLFNWAAGTDLECKIINNTIKNCEGFGINAVCTSNTLIKENYINNNAWQGMDFSDSSHNQIYNNTVEYNEMGIVLWDSEWNNISENRLNHNTVYGIRICDSSNNSVDYNTINNNDENGIHIELNCTENNITHNHIHDNSWYGIVFDDSSSDYNIVTQNYLWDNTNGPIAVSGGSGNQIYDNYLTRPNNFAMTAEDPAIPRLLEENYTVSGSLSYDNFTEVKNREVFVFWQNGTDEWDKGT